MSTGPTGEERPATGFSTVWGALQAHPWITGIMFVCTVGGAIAGPVLMDADWPLIRQVAAGGFLGAWAGLTMTAIKMIG